MKSLDPCDSDPVLSAVLNFCVRIYSTKETDSGNVLPNVGGATIKSQAPVKSDALLKT